MHGWSYTNIKDSPRLRADGSSLELSPLQEDNIMNRDEAIYWIASEPFLGDKV